MPWTGHTVVISVKSEFVADFLGYPGEPLLQDSWPDRGGVAPKPFKDLSARFPDFLTNQDSRYNGITMYDTILVSTDGSELSKKAIREADKLAHRIGSKLVLIYVVANRHLPPLTEGFSSPDRSAERERARKDMEAEGQAVISDAAKSVTMTRDTLEQHFVISDSPYEAIIEAARQSDCSLIVMASHGRRGLSGVLLGSETQKVLTHSKIPVLVVR